MINTTVFKLLINPRLEVSNFKKRPDFARGVFVSIVYSTVSFTGTGLLIVAPFAC